MINIYQQSNPWFWTLLRNSLVFCSGRNWKRWPILLRRLRPWRTNYLGISRYELIDEEIRKTISWCSDLVWTPNVNNILQAKSSITPSSTDHKNSFKRPGFCSSSIVIGFFFSLKIINHPRSGIRSLRLIVPRLWRLPLRTDKPC